MNDEEQRAMDALGAAMGIIKGWSQRKDGFYHNQDQLVLGIHLVQQFIVQHMLVREHPDQWANWWPPEEESHASD